MAVVLILAVLWAIVLGPPLVRRVMEHRSNESIDSFHHSLHLLERTGPKLIEPAFRLETSGAVPGVLTQSPAGAGRPNLVLLKAVEGPEGGADAVVDQASGERFERLGTPPEVVGAGATRPSLAERAEEYRRQRNRRRRREIVTGIGGTALITGIAGFDRALHPLWVLTVLCFVALGAYGFLYHYARALGEPAQGRRPKPSPSARRPVQRRQRIEEEPDLADSPRDWDLHRAATAGYPGAWDDLDLVAASTQPWSAPPAPSHPNVVLMNPGASASSGDDEVEERYGVRLYRGAAAGR